MKQEKEFVVRACAYCHHAILTPTTQTEAPPLAFFLAYPCDEAGAVLHCPYKKQISPEGRCFRFRFDPLKYRPKPLLAPILLDEDGIL